MRGVKRKILTEIASLQDSMFEKIKILITGLKMQIDAVSHHLSGDH